MTAHHALVDNGNQITVNLTDVPDECAFCHRKGTFSPIYCFYNTKAPADRRVEVIFRCPNSKCHKVLIGYYGDSPIAERYTYQKMVPQENQIRIFPEAITQISRDFPAIYNQALQAETENLDQICGPGYRKALEFLIKDYLISVSPDVAIHEAIKNEFLGTSISSRITDQRIKEVAKRAAWLGNDETHYTRKWSEKDLQDLKNLIDLTIHWMEAEALTTKLLEDMPDSGPVVTI